MLMPLPSEADCDVKPAKPSVGAENELGILTETVVEVAEPSDLAIMGYQGASAISESNNTLKTELLDFLAGSSAHFKSQQIGEPELTFLQKRSIASELIKRNPGQFLARFGTNIKLEHLDYFTPLKEDYEVDFYIKKLQRFHSKKLSEVDVKNRRYEALQRLISEGSYFSEEEMKNRNPLLYEQLVGQHLTKDERDERIKDYSKMTYVGYLLDRMDRDERNELQQKQQDEEDGAVEELDTDDESSIADDDEMAEEIDEKEKAVLRQEFVNSMYHSFLEGKDSDFDYSTVDFNAEYDSHRDMDHDDEEKYFDSESPESIKEENSEAVDNVVSDEEDALDTYMSTLE